MLKKYIDPRDFFPGLFVIEFLNATHFVSFFDLKAAVVSITVYHKVPNYNPGYNMKINFLWKKFDFKRLNFTIEI